MVGLRLFSLKRANSSFLTNFKHEEGRINWISALSTQS